MSKKKKLHYAFYHTPDKALCGDRRADTAGITPLSTEDDRMGHWRRMTLESMIRSWQYSDCVRCIKIFHNELIQD